MFSIPKWLGFAGPLAMLALLVSSVLLWNRAESLKAQLGAAQTQASLFESYARVQETALFQKDAVIQQQSASVDALAAAARQARATYDAANQVAASAAASQNAAAQQLLSLSAPEGELAQCRAARDLLEEELLHEQPR